jgi:hypothetical protein
MPPVFRTAYWDEHWRTRPRSLANRPLPPFPHEVYRAICGEAGDEAGAGAWDVILWRGKEMVFVEAKRFRSSDCIDDSQVRWLEAARRLGIPRARLVFAAWDAQYGQPAA